MVRGGRTAVAGCLVLVAAAGLIGCGSSSKGASGGSSGTTVAAGAGNRASSTTVTDGNAAKPSDVDPCSLFSKDDMAEEMGATDVTAEASEGVSPTCTYYSAAHHLSVELAVLDEAHFAATPRNPNVYTGDQAATATVLDVTGIGDEVFGYTTKGGVTLVSRKGAVGYSLLMTNAGGGADAGNWADDAAMLASAKSIMTAVVGT